MSHPSPPPPGWLTLFEHMGNHWGAGIWWAAIGLVAAVAAPWCLYSKDSDEIKSLASACAFLLASFLYLVAWNARHLDIMRKGLPWWGTVIGNLIVLAISCLTLALHYMFSSHRSDRGGFWGFVLVGISVFCLSQLSKPEADFGLLQFFLRQPIQTSTGHYPDHVLWHVVGGLLWFFGTVWNTYFVQVFRDSLAAALGTSTVPGSVHGGSGLGSERGHQDDAVSDALDLAHEDEDRLRAVDDVVIDMEMANAVDVEPIPYEDEDDEELEGRGGQGWNS